MQPCKNAVAFGFESSALVRLGLELFVPSSHSCPGQIVEQQHHVFVTVWSPYYPCYKFLLKIRNETTELFRFCYFVYFFVPSHHTVRICFPRCSVSQQFSYVSDIRRIQRTSLSLRKWPGLAVVSQSRTHQAV